MCGLFEMLVGGRGGEKGLSFIISHNAPMHAHPLILHSPLHACCHRQRCAGPLGNPGGLSIIWPLNRPWPSGWDTDREPAVDVGRRQLGFCCR